MRLCSADLVPVPTNPTAVMFVGKSAVVCFSVVLVLFRHPFCALQADSETVVPETHFANEFDLASSECLEGLNRQPQGVYAGFKPARTVCISLRYFRLHFCWQ